MWPRCVLTHLLYFVNAKTVNDQILTQHDSYVCMYEYTRLIFHLHVSINLPIIYLCPGEWEAGASNTLVTLDPKMLRVLHAGSGS